MNFGFDAVLFRWDARSDAAWFFVAVPEELGAMIREIPRAPRGFGAVRVEALVAGVRWRTSVFPSSVRTTYVLPVKRAVRDAAGAGEGDEVHVEITVLEG